ncbi:MAG TPA: tetratricopeptide repeat protein, partial [Phenylobacterium sp.]
MLRGWALAIGVVVMMTTATASAEPVARPIDATVAQVFQRRLLAAPGPPYAGRIAVLRDMLARYTADYGAAHPTTNSVRQSLASYLFADHQYAEAAPLLDTVLRQYEATSPPNPVLISEVLQVAAANAEALGRLKDAERAWRRMLDVDAARGAPTLAAFMGLITNLDRQSRGKEVIDLLKARLESERKAGGYLGDLALNLGNRLYQADGREREAEPILRLALAEAERVQGPTSRRVGDAATALGDDLAYLDNYRDAQALHRRALAIFEATDGQDSIAVARVSDRLGEALKDDRKLADAVVAYSRALDIYEARLGYKDDRTVSVATTLGAALMAVAKVADAEQRMGAAERVSVQLNGEDHVRTARLRVVLAITRGTRGDTEGAVRLLQAALPILERDAGPKDDDTQVARLTLKAMLGKQGLNVRETKSAAAAPSTADEAAFQAFVKCNDDSEVPIKDDLEHTLAQLEKDRLPPLMLIGCQMKLGIFYGADEQYQKSAALLAKADAGISQLLGPQAPERAPIVAARAAAAHELGRYAESASLFREGCDTLER